MEPLDPELQSLVAAERGQVEPSVADRERVGRSLAPRVGAGFGLGIGLVASPAAGTGAAVAGSAGLLLKVAGAVVLAGAVAVVAVPRLGGSGASAPPRAAAAAPAAQAVPVASPSPSAALPEPEPVTEAPSEPPASAARNGNAASPSLPPLAEEARLLKQAQQALRSGQPAAALSALTEHQRRFPRGQLALERSAARIQALCGLGQKQQAEREGTAFLKQHPGSGLSAQVRASCGFAAPSR